MGSDRKPASAQWDTVQDLVLSAHARLQRPIWEYVTYGADSETTVRRNRFALDGYALVQSVLRDVSDLDVGGSLVGRELRIPVLLAPIGSIARFDPAGPKASAEAAAKFGTLQFHASHATEDVPHPVGGEALPVIYALHPQADLARFDRDLDAIAGRRYAALSFATQSGVYSRRERDIANGLLGKGQSRRPYAEVIRAGRNGSVSTELDKLRLTWSMLERAKIRSGLPLILKGVQTGADAKRAIDHGVDVVYVSNNGGRALDQVPGTMDLLPEIVEAVGGRAQVIVDGGFVRGADIVKARAVGADAVCVGRLQAWALAAGGVPALVRALEILEEELFVTLALMGVTSLRALRPEHLRRVQPCVPPHPLSAFPIVMERLRLPNC